MEGTLRVGAGAINEEQSEDEGTANVSNGLVYVLCLCKLTHIIGVFHTILCICNNLLRTLYYSPFIDP